MQLKGECSLNVKLTDGRIVHRHLDHIRLKVGSTPSDTGNSTTFEVDDPLMYPLPLSEDPPSSPSTLAPRRSSRNRRPPDRLTF